MATKSKFCLLSLRGSSWMKMGDMPSPKSFEQSVREIAFALPEVEEGIVCNRASFAVGKKRFLFLEAAASSCLVMVKLRDSLPEANKLAKATPECFRVGSTNWVTAVFPAGQHAPPGLLERWIAESYCLIVPKKLAALVRSMATKSSDGLGQKNGGQKKRSKRLK